MIDGTNHFLMYDTDRDCYLTLRFNYESKLEVIETNYNEYYNNVSWVRNNLLITRETLKNPENIIIIPVYSDYDIENPTYSLWEYSMPFDEAFDWNEYGK